jgi:pilus assembly protein CpaE
VEGLARVVLGLDAQDVAEEVMHFLDRSERVRVVGAASDDRQLAAAVRQLEPDVVLASPGMLRSSAGLNGSPVIAVDTEESVGGLRAALAGGARGFFLWPAERDELAAAAAHAGPKSESPRDRASVLAVTAARGGAGATFVATHLAAAFARLGKDCVLVDMDAGFGEIEMALGVPRDPEPRTIHVLAPVADELSERHLSEAAWEHPQGFRVLLAPRQPDSVSPDDYRSILAALARHCDVVVVHLPRGIDEVARAAVALADRVLMVLNLDVLSFHGARRTLAALGDDERFAFVVNRAGRSEIAPGDVERVFGREPLAVLPDDHAVPNAQDRGRLVPPRGKTGRAMTRLARTLAGSDG